MTSQKARFMVGLPWQCSSVSPGSRVFLQTEETVKQRNSCEEIHIGNSPSTLKFCAEELTSSPGVTIVAISVAFAGLTASSWRQRIAKITRSTAEEHGIKYQESLTFQKVQYAASPRHSPLTLVSGVAVSADALEVSKNLSATDREAANRGQSSNGRNTSLDAHRRSPTCLWRR